MTSRPLDDETHRSRWRRLRAVWRKNLHPSEQSAIVSWGAFTLTFASVRVLTHWIRGGHGPGGGGLSFRGRHFHHYNLGLAALAGVGAVAVRGTEKQRHHPAVAISYGVGTALIVDELALLLDLQDVYWAKEGRTSVDAAVVIIGLGGLMTAGFEFWPEARRVLTEAT